MYNVTRILLMSAFKELYRNFLSADRVSLSKLFNVRGVGMSVSERDNLPTEKGDNVYSVGVIGGGTISVAFINSFVDQVMSQNMTSIKLTLFEKKNVIGTGYPYQEDFDSLKLNAPYFSMSISATNEKHFPEWLQGKEEYREILEEGPIVPRSIYGKYLTDTLHTAMEKAGQDIECEIVYKEVVDINKISNDQYEVVTEEDQVFVFDFVLLTVGGSQSDPYQLMGESGYIHTPYPAKETLANISKSDTVAILGTRLTGIDMALALRQKGHEGSIFMLSKNGRLPTIVDKHDFYQTQFFTFENAHRFVQEHDGVISLRQVVRFMRKEFKSAALDWRDILLDRREWHDDVETVRQRIDVASDKLQTWFDMLFGMLPVLASIWNYIPQRDKQFLHGKYMADFTRQQMAFPLINAMPIYDMLVSGQLHILGGIDAVRKEEHTFHVTLNDGQDMTCDHIINATGFSHDVSKNSLINRLLTKGYLVQDHSGGIQVDYNSGAVIDKDGKQDNTFRAIGHLAHGNYLLVDVLPVYLPLSHQVAGQVVEMINTEQTPSLS